MKKLSIFFCVMVLVAGLALFESVNTVWADQYSFTTLFYPNSSETQAFGINDSGVVVGRYEVNGFEHGLIYENGNYTSFDHPDGTSHTNLTGINDSGQMIGLYYGSDMIARSFSFINNTFTDLIFPNSHKTVALDINNSGSVVGYYKMDANDTTHGFIYDGTTFSKIEYPGYNTTTQALGMNDAGQVVGKYFDGNFGYRNFLFDGINAFQTISIPGAPEDASVGDLNDVGQFIGERNGLMYISDLVTASTITVPGSLFNRAMSINNSGQIAGYFYNEPTQKFGFIGSPVPVPEPSIIVTFPDGEEELTAGTTHEITWTSEGEIDAVTIEYSVNDGEGWTEIVASTENDGSFYWDVPCDLSDDSLIKISDVDSDAYDTSDAVFFIVDIDSDGVCGDIDNCPEDYNPEQLDYDEDGIGDICDVDADDDGFTFDNDCDDLDYSINPDACDIKKDDIDQDCDGFDRTRGKPCPSGGDNGKPSSKEGPAQTCNDGIDNDDDGYTDCDDSDCAKKKNCRDN